MASLDSEHSLLNISINELSDNQIRRRLTQEFNFNCGPINNSTRKVLLKKLERLESKRNSFQDSFSVPRSADDGEKEKENFLNFSSPKHNRNLNDIFEQNFGKESNEEPSPLVKSSQIYTPSKKTESPTKAKERKSVRIDETVTEIATAVKLSQHEEEEDEEDDVSNLLQSYSNLPPAVSSNEYFKRPHCRPPIRRSTDSHMAYELDDSKRRRSHAISPVLALFSNPYFLITIAVVIAILATIYMYLF